MILCGCTVFFSLPSLNLQIVLLKPFFYLFGLFMPQLNSKEEVQQKTEEFRRKSKSKMAAERQENKIKV